MLHCSDCSAKMYSIVVRKVSSQQEVSRVKDRQWNKPFQLYIQYKLGKVLKKLTVSKGSRGMPL